MAEVDTSFYPKANPNAMFDTAKNYGEIANMALQNKLLQKQNVASQQDIVKSQVNYLANGLGSLASKPDLTADDMHAFATRAVKEGIISPETYQAEMEAVQATGGDPTKLRSLATNYALRAVDAGKAFDLQFGTAGMIDNGQTQTPVSTSPLTGIHAIGAPIQTNLTPAQVAAPTTIGVTPAGQPITGTQGQFLEAAGANPLTGQSNPPAPAGGNALMPTAPGAAPQVASPLPPYSSLPAAGPGIVTTPVPGTVEAQTAVGAGSGGKYAEDLQRQSAYQQNVLPLEKAIPALEALGTTGTGPGREQVQAITSFLQSMGVPGMDTANIKNFDEAKKYLTQFVNQNGNSATNDKLAASFAGNPSVEISNAAAIDVAKTALSLARMENAQVLSFQQKGLPPAEYLKESAAFNAQQDPRAYGLDLMTPAARTKLIGSLKGDDRAKFANSLRTAIGLGLVSAPVQAAPNGQ